MTKTENGGLKRAFEQAFIDLPKEIVLEDKDSIAIILRLGEWKKIINDLEERGGK